MAFINSLALDGEIYFRFKGWDPIDGKTQFDFCFKRAADEEQIKNKMIVFYWFEN